MSMDADCRERELQRILLANDWFVAVLKAARDCAPPGWVVGGGVIRNVVWDLMHGYTQPTSIADVDVAFFDPADLRSEREEEIETCLHDRLPDVSWDVKNQAAVHLWYEHVFGEAVAPLQSLADAIGTWPETATSVGVRLTAEADLLVVAPCGLDDLLQMILRRNPRRVSREQFDQRAVEKGILQKWPGVRIIHG
jgi:uncharacterized protein